MKEKWNWKIVLILFLLFPCIIVMQGCGGDGGTKEKPINVSYTVSFFTNSGDDFNYPNQNIEHGRLVRRPSNPVKEGYIFVAWYSDQECTKVWNFDVDTVTSNMTLYAGWIEGQDNVSRAVSYTVSFFTNSRDDFNYPNQNIEHGRLVRRPSNPVKEGYIFVAWYSDQECTKVWNFDVDTVTSNMSLYAGWIEV